MCVCVCVCACVCVCVGDLTDALLDLAWTPKGQSEKKNREEKRKENRKARKKTETRRGGQQSASERVRTHPRGPRGLASALVTHPRGSRVLPPALRCPQSACSFPTDESPRLSLCYNSPDSRLQLTRFDFTTDEIPWLFPARFQIRRTRPPYRTRCFY